MGRNKGNGGQPVFIIEKGGKAYFKDKMLCMVCKPAKMVTVPKYPGYNWEFDYMEKLDWFKKYVTLFMTNKGKMKFIGMDLEEFNQLGGTPITINGGEVRRVSDIKRK